MSFTIVLQDEKFKKRIASADTADYKVIPRGKLVQGIHIDEANFGIQDIVDEGIVSPAYKVWEVDSSIIFPKYLEMIMRSPRSLSFYRSKLNGSVNRRGRMTDDDFLAMSIPFVDYEQQKKIVTIILQTSNIISLYSRQLHAFDTLIKARFVEMFGSQEGNPLCFNVGTLKDVADIYLGLTHTPTYVTEGKPFLSVRDISSGKIDFTNCHYISEQEFASLPNGARPKPNDILFCRVGTIGKPVIIPEGTPEFGSFVSVGFLRKKSNVLNDYLKSWMEDPYFMKQVYDNVAGASQINLNTGWLKNFSILIPPIELQKEFTVFVSQVDKSKVVVQKALDEAQLLFDSLMQKYFG